MKLKNHQQLHHTFFELVIYQGKIFLKKNIKKKICHIFLEFYIDQEYNQIKKLYELLYNIFHESYRIQTHI